MNTIKVKPWGKDQGDYVLIDSVDYDEKTHKLYDEKPAKPAKPVKQGESE